MLSSYDIESMQSKLKDGEFIKMYFNNDGVLSIDETDTILHPMMPLGQEEDVSSLNIERKSGKRLLINLNRVDYVCTSTNRLI